MAVQGPILSLDLASQTGWAVGEPGKTIRYGSLKLGNPGWGREYRYHALRDFFMDMAAIEKPWAVVFESSFNLAMMMSRSSDGGMKTNVETVKMLIGFTAVVGEAAVACKIPVLRETDANSVRNYFLGKGRPRKRDEVKRAVMQRCTQFGWAPKNTDSADALATWAFAESIWSPETAAQRLMNAMAAGVPERLSAKEYRQLKR